jgi:hypothetical protein
MTIWDNTKATTPYVKVQYYTGIQLEKLSKTKKWIRIKGNPDENPLKNLPYKILDLLTWPMFYHMNPTNTDRGKYTPVASRHQNVWGSGGIAPLFLTSALDGDGGECSASYLCGFTPPRVTIIQEAGWAPEPVWTLWRRDKSLTLLGIKPRSLCCPVSSLVTMLTELSRLPIHTDSAQNDAEKTLRQNMTCWNSDANVVKRNTNHHITRTWMSHPSPAGYICSPHKNQDRP